MIRFALVIFSLAFVWGAGLTQSGQACWCFGLQQQGGGDEEANQLAELATRAQNSGDYRFAIDRWEKLIAEYPEVSFIGKAHHFLGLCWVELRRFDLANPQFEQAIRKFPAEETTLLPQAYLYLGYTQFQLGLANLQSFDSTAQKEANVWLTTSTQTFADLINRFPEFQDVDQASFFQATAYQNLDRGEDAIDALEKMLTYPNPQFRFQGLLLAGQIKEQLGQPEKAIEYFERFRQTAGETGHPRMEEVDLSHGKALMTLANQQLKQGLAAAAIASYREAETRLAKLQQFHSEQPAEVESPAHEAAYQRAFCLANLDRKQEAAELFAEVGSRVNSPFRLDGLLNAGRLFQELGELDRAIAEFRTASAVDSPAAAEGGVLLAGAYLANDQPDAAYQTADQWIAKKPLIKTLPFLLNYRAEAAYKLDSLRSDSPNLFLQVADQFPSHSLAAAAIYNAAFGYFQLNQHEQAVAAVDRLEASYPESEFIPDALEIKADCLLLTDEDSAELLFQELVQQFPQHKNVNRWLLRDSVAKFIQGKYQASIDLLLPQIDRFSNPRQIAEAYHWLGLNSFYLEDYAGAVQYLQQSLDRGEPWRSTDETLLTMAQSELKRNQPEAAQSALQRLIDDFPSSPLVDRAYFFLGESAFQSDKFASALENFSKLLGDSLNTELTPAALYNAGWCLIKLERYEEATQFFTRLIDEFPDHNLVADARAGRGVANRKGGDMEGSISDLKTFVETDAAGEQKWKAMYEMGLAFVEKEAYEEAVATFAQLIQEDPQSAKLDSYLYEAAWALHSLGKTEEALQQFATLIEKKPESVFAAEAHFHVASAAYDQNDFETAQAAFEQSVASAQTTLEGGLNPGVAVVQKKALYKLGWTQYKLEDYPAARDTFAQLVDQFPDSELAADSWFMVAESLFQNDLFEDSLLAYQQALSKVEASTSVDSRIKFLNRLHGAQAANKIKKAEIALEMALPLTDPSLAENGMPTPSQADAWLEIGTAYQALGKTEECLANWGLAKRWGGAKTSARARCLIGDQFFLQRQFDDAISEFKEVFYRYGNDQVSEGVQAWVAYALYETARCYYVQIADASAEQKSELIKDAIRNFELLVENYPEDALAPEAQRQLEMLKKIRRKP